jgi:hypothetical protein
VAALAVGALAIAVAGAGCGSQGGAASEASTTSAADEAAQHYADEAAASLAAVSGTSVTEAVVFPSASRNEALAAIDSGSIPGPAGDAEVITVELDGNFTLNGVSRPSGAQAPTATQYFVVIDLATGEMLDAGGGNNHVDPSGQLGEPTIVRVSGS